MTFGVIQRLKKQFFRSEFRDVCHMFAAWCVASTDNLTGLHTYMRLCLVELIKPFVKRIKAAFMDEAESAPDPLDWIVVNLGRRHGSDRSR